MNFDVLHSPTAFLEQMLGALPHEEVLREYETWWEQEGKAISAAVDRQGMPWLRMFGVFGRRVDEILQFHLTSIRDHTDACAIP